MGGLIDTQSSDTTMEMSPDHTKTTVGTLPLLPISPFANGYRWHSTQKLKNTPPISLLHWGNGLYSALDTPTAIAIMFTIMIVIGGTIRKLHFTTYSSANRSSLSSLAGFDVRVNEMSTPATTFKIPCRTAAGCALVPPISQNCSFRHHSCSVIPDHLISSMASSERVTLITRSSARNVTPRDCTMNCPVNRLTAGSVQ